MTNPIDSVFADVGNELRFVAPSFIFAKSLTDNDSPPRYVFEPKGGPLTGRKVPSVTVDGKVLPVCQNLQLTFHVHCWGKTTDEAWHLFTALVNVLRKLFSANVIPGNVECGKPANATLGFIFTLPIVINAPVVEADIPTSGPERQGATDKAETTLTPPVTFSEKSPRSRLPATASSRAPKPEASHARRREAGRPDRASAAIRSRDRTGPRGPS